MSTAETSALRLAIPAEVADGRPMSMLEAALAWSRAGWKVLPVRSKAWHGKGRDGREIDLKPKAPLTKHGVKDATTDEEQIRKWWAQWPDAAVGIAAGHGRIVVIDADLDEERRPAGAMEVQALFRSLGVKLDTAEQRTPSGGRQYLFRLPEHLSLEDVKNAVGKGQPGRPAWPALPDCDVRCLDGYFVAGPSRIGPYAKAPEGGSYEWCGETLVPQDMPEGLYAILPKRSAPQPQPVPQASSPAPLPCSWQSRPSVPAGHARAYAEATLARIAGELSGEPHGSRNGALNEAALRVFRVFMGAGLDYEPIYRDLRKACEDNGLLRDDGEGQFIATMKSALKAAEKAGPATIPEPSPLAPRPASGPAPQPPRGGSEDAPLSILPPPEDVPRGLFPQPVEDAIADVADKKGDGQYNLAFAPCLAVFGAAVGGKRKAAVRKASPQPGNIWVCVLGGYGAGKSPCAEPFVEPLQDRNTQAYDEWEAAYEEASRKLQDYRRRAKQKNGLQEGEEEPKLPSYPPMAKLSGDTTMEALGKAYKACRDRGLVPSAAIFSDELRGAFKAMGCYHSGGPVEELPQQLLSLYDGAAWDTNRAAAERNMTIPHCYLSIFGGLQTALVGKLFTPDVLEAGGLGRFMFFRGEPPMHAKWRDDDLKPETREVIHYVVGSLLDMPRAEPPAGSGGGPIDLSGLSDTIGLTAEASEAMARWYEENRTRAAVEGNLGMFSKLSKQSSRIALILHLVRQVFLPEAEREPLITAETMHKAFQLTAYLERRAMEVRTLVTAGTKAASLEAVHREASRIFLSHIDEIKACEGKVANATLVEWLNAGGVKATSRSLQDICTPLGVAPLPSPLSRGVRGRRITDAALAVMARAAGVDA